MPSIAAHYFFGQEVLKLLPANIAELIKRHKSAFDLGLQGPDLLFYYHPLHNNNIINKGTNIHKEKARIFIEAAIKRTREKNDSISLSYLLGFTCHFVLDSSLHSTITKAAPDKRSHILLETELDRIVIYNNYSHKPHIFQRYKLVKLKTENIDFLLNIYPDLSSDELRICTKSIVFYNRLLYSKTGIKRLLLRLFERSYHKSVYLIDLMITKNKNKKYSDTANSLYTKFKYLLSDAVFAVMKVYNYNKKATLDNYFEKNFE